MKILNKKITRTELAKMTPVPRHQNLAKGPWQKLTFFQQMVNVGAEMGQAIKWRRRNTDYSRLALERMSELFGSYYR